MQTLSKFAVFWYLNILKSFQDKSGCEATVHQRDTEEKPCYLTQVIKIGHLIKNQLGWVSWVSYIKELVWLATLVKSHLSNVQVMEPSD